MIENEVKILRMISHPNIISLAEDHDTKTMLYLVCEYVAGKLPCFRIWLLVNFDQNFPKVGDFFEKLKVSVKGSNFCLILFSRKQGQRRVY